ncbi:DNA recombination protein RmuC [Granulicella sp. 5B5]|uniref:DNA recombination protein RmuC n=1 Tax=Granulicella sp. 5B5 TaxID=1617967 RepID=UPI0015F40B30|nr:DNA recombination protein RmuC [Granulicella sp. 5B5]QMV18581.1 DNA recombination protein RmuC [Granulicella sp. 5B5]
MLYAVIALSVLNFLLLLMLLLRKTAQSEPTVDPRLAQLLAADLPTQMTKLDVRSETLDAHLREQLAQLRKDAAESSVALRGEVLGSIDLLGKSLTTSLDSFRADNTLAANTLRTAVTAQQESLQQKLSAFTSDANRSNVESREALHQRLDQLREGQTAHMDSLRATVEARLDALNQNNAAKLEEMRITVDEKLHATLQTRLTESFGQVTDQLTKVHAGLGEMSKLSAGVDDLSRIFTNVKSRGGIGELALEMLLKDRLAPSQYIHNVKVKPNSQEVVEFAVRFPTPNGEMLLPIDSKFPREVFERLEAAYESGNDVVSAGRAFEAAIRFEGKKICDKYIAPPFTTSFAIMFLPTEGLYAEVIRRDGLLADIQQSCQVTIAGPSTLSAILTSFQMGFHMLQMQEKGDEVWKVLANARKEFGTFEKLMDKMTDDVGRVQGTIDKLGVRTRAINRTLRDVSLESGSEDQQRIAAGKADNFDGLLPMLAASDDEVHD